MVAPIYTDNGFDIAGGSAWAELELKAQQFGLSVQQYLAMIAEQGGMAPYAPPDVDRDYYGDIIKAFQEYEGKYGRQRDPATGQPPRDLWMRVAAGATGIDPTMLGTMYDRVVGATGITWTPEKWNNLLGSVAQEGRPSLQNQLAQAQLSGYYNEKPTLAREQAEWERRQAEQNAQFGRQQAEWGAGMDLARLGSQMSGPEDYFQWANMLAGYEGSPVLGFAQQAAAGQPIAAFGNWNPGQTATPSSAVTPPTWGQKALPATGPGGPVPQQDPNAPPWDPNAVTQMPDLSNLPPSPPMPAGGWPGLKDYPGAGSNYGYWPDSSMGQAQPGKVYTQPLTPGTATNPGPYQYQLDTAYRTSPVGGFTPYTGSALSGQARSGAMQGASTTPRFAQPNVTAQGATGTYRPTTGSSIGRVQITAPHQLTPQALGSWTGRQRDVYNSALKDRGIDVNDYYELQSRAAPKGTSAMPTRWG